MLRPALAAGRGMGDRARASGRSEGNRGLASAPRMAARLATQRGVARKRGRYLGNPRELHKLSVGAGHQVTVEREWNAERHAGDGSGRHSRRPDYDLGTRETAAGGLSICDPIPGDRHAQRCRSP